MAKKFTQGPNVYRNEVDQSDVASPTGTSVGAFVGKANQGPVNQRVQVNRDKELLQVFGNPSVSLGYGIYGALEFLKESDNLYFVRATSGTEGYAHVGITTSGAASYGNIVANSSTALLSVAGYEDGNKPNDNYDVNSYSFSGEPIVIASVGPGSYGNNLAISIVTCANDVSAGFDWKYRYDSNPTTDTNPIWQKVFKINVYQKANNTVGFGSVSATPVETFYVSRQNVVDDNNNNLYIEKVINGVSKYIYVKDNLSVASTTNPGTTNGPVQLLSGTDNTSVPYGVIQSAWTLFTDREKVDVNILVCTEPGDGSSNNFTVQQTVGNIAASRKDCIALCQVDGTSSTVTNVSTITANASFNFSNPSYVALYAGWDMIYDRFNDKNIYIPKNIFGAALMARTDAIANTWDAPAGINRGRISSLAQNVLFNGTQIGTLRDNNINTSKFIRGQGGNFMWLQKTALRKSSALSDINVRRLLIFVENSIENALLPFIFESNNDKTRLRIKSILDGFLGQVASGGGFNTDIDAGFKVIVDRTNNTPDVVANNQLIVDIFCKPITTIEFIQLNMIVTRSGISFSESV